MPPRAQYYINTSREFYARARAYLATNDLLQTSEKGWGAAALRVKSVAELRGWRHREHRDLGKWSKGWFKRPETRNSAAFSRRPASCIATFTRVG